MRADRGFALDELAPPQAEDDEALRDAHGPELAAAPLTADVPAARLRRNRPGALDALLAARQLRHPDHRRDGAPYVSHLPVLYRRDGDHVELSGHWARPNPQARHAGPALVIVHGPHAYVSPVVVSGQGSRAARVPTWNYAVAHLHGTLETLPTTKPRWRSSSILSAPASKRRSARTGVSNSSATITARNCAASSASASYVERVELKFKLNQNHPARQSRKRWPRNWSAQTARRQPRTSPH